MMDRETALKKIAVGDIFHASLQPSGGPSYPCLALQVREDRIYARRMSTQSVHWFDRRTGVDVDDNRIVIDSVEPLPEEIHEIMTSLGMEYWYHDTFAARMGYFLEAKDKGNRKYLTLGAGFRKDIFGFDIAYLVPTNKREHPLAETIRFSLLFQVKQKQENEKTVTDDQ